MGRRGGGGMRGGGGRMGGGLGRSGSGRGLSGGGLGSAGRAGRGGLGGGGLGGARAGGGFGTGRAPAPRAPMGRPGSFGAGMATGMGIGMMAGGGRRRRGWGMGGGWGWGRRRRMPMGGMGMGPGMMGPRRGGGGCGGGCITLILIIIAIIFVISIISWFGNLASPQNWVQGGTIQLTEVTAATRVREALPRGTATDTGPLYTDHLDWIGNRTVLERGMRNFHQATGVRPHVYIIGEIYGTQTPSVSQLGSFARQRYDELFNDEAHVLFLFFENAAGQYGMYVVPGNQAQTVMDQEAQDILMDYAGRYYYMDISTEEFFSRVFDSTAERIMHVPPNNRTIWMTVIIVAGVLLLVFLLFRWWQRKQEQKNIEAEQLERVLNQPLETIGNPNDAASRLADEYTDPNDPNNQ
ncbi:MAG: hypothetical protein FWE42_01030 [Defluviitaleaceae bacterium]|nr:hypothetical protein [Defluviitaleaceae bacterium]